MVGIGVVTDPDKFRKYQERHSDDVIGYDPIEELTKNYSDLDRKGQFYIVEEPTNYGSEVSLSIEDYEKAGGTINESPDIAVLCIGNNEGDSAFTVRGDDDDDPWDCELNHDIDLDWFSEDQQRVFLEFGEESGISFADVRFGAGRNG
jgi:hypothetical protein